MVGRFSAAAAVAAVIALFSFAFAMAEGPRLKFVSGDVEGYIRGGQCAPEVDLIIVSPKPTFFTASDNPVFRFVRGAKLSLQFECAGDSRISTIQIYGYVGEELVYRAETLIGSNSPLRNVRIERGKLHQDEYEDAGIDADQVEIGDVVDRGIPTSTYESILRYLKLVAALSVITFIAFWIISYFAFLSLRKFSPRLVKLGLLYRPTTASDRPRLGDIIIRLGLSVALIGSLTGLAVLLREFYQLWLGNVQNTLFGLTLGDSEIYTFLLGVLISFFATLIGIQQSVNSSRNLNRQSEIMTLNVMLPQIERIHREYQRIPYFFERTEKISRKISIALPWLITTAFRDGGHQSEDPIGDLLDIDKAEFEEWQNDLDVHLAELSKLSQDEDDIRSYCEDKTAKIALRTMIAEIEFLTDYLRESLDAIKGHPLSMAVWGRIYAERRNPTVIDKYDYFMDLATSGKPNNKKSRARKAADHEFFINELREALENINFRGNFGELIKTRFIPAAMLAPVDDPWSDEAFKRPIRNIEVIGLIISQKDLLFEKSMKIDGRDDELSVDKLTFNRGLALLLTLLDAYPVEKDDMFNALNYQFDFRLGETARNIIDGNDYRGISYFEENEWDAYQELSNFNLVIFSDSGNALEKSSHLLGHQPEALKSIGIAHIYKI